MTGDQLDEYYNQVDSNLPDPSVITPHSSQLGRISHTILVTAPSDSFSMQNEYTHPHNGTRDAYPPFLSTAQARCQNLLHHNNKIMNDVLEKNDLL